MSRFDELNAAFEEPQAAPPQSQDVFGDLSMPAKKVEADDESFVDRLFGRFENSLDRRQLGFADALADAKNPLQGGTSLTGRMSPESSPLESTSLMGSTMLRTAGQVPGFVMDVGADIVAEGFGTLWDITPESIKHPMEEGARKLLQTDTGKNILAAFQTGGEAWEQAKEAYPQETAILQPSFDLLAAGGSKLLTAPLNTTVTPLRAERVGYRNTLAPAKGRDKDVFNVITPVESPVVAAERAKGLGTSGGVSDPQGVLGRQSPIPTAEEWAIVDEVKKLAVSGARTFQENTNTIANKIRELGDQTSRVARKSRGEVTNKDIAEHLQNKMDISVRDNPALWGAEGTKGTSHADDVFAQLFRFIDNEGGSYEGLLNARRDLDSYMAYQMKTNPWDGATMSAKGEALNVARGAINDLVAAGAPDTRDLLKRQTRLYKALDATSFKAAHEAETSIGRMLQTLNIKAPSTPLAQSSTLQALATSPVLGMGALAVSPLYLTHKVSQKVWRSKGVSRLKDPVANVLANTNAEMKKVAATIKDPKIKKQLYKDIGVVDILIHTYESDYERAHGEDA